MKNNKKGEFNPNIISGAIIALLVMVIIFGITFQLSDKFQQGFADTTASVTNETHYSIVNGTAFTLDYNYSGTPCWDKDYFSVDHIINATGASVDYTSGTDFTYSNLGTVTPSSADALSTEGSGWKVSYTYKYSDQTREECSAAENTSDAMATVPTWLVIIVLILIAVIILGMLGRFRGGKTTAQI